MAHEWDGSPSHCARRATSCFSNVRKALALPDLVDVLVEQGIDMAAGLVRRGGELQQLPDLGRWDVQRPAMTDELQALHVPVGIAAVA
nr:hypothetical protein [Variovorax sp. YR216]